MDEVCFLLPLTFALFDNLIRTVEFPHAFLSSSVDSPSFNSASYVSFSYFLGFHTNSDIDTFYSGTFQYISKGFCMLISC